MKSRCKTRYPIILIHGAGFRDDSRFYNYWGRIPDALEQEGAQIFYSKQDAWGSIEYNAEIIKKSIQKVLSATKTKKVNLVAHSRGGLEARYLINELGMEEAVATLTTISTPHHGSKIMDFFYKWPKIIYKLVSFFINVFFRILGDKKPDFFTSSRQLSSIMCKEFNIHYPDKPLVYYQSFATKMRNSFSDPLFIITHFITKLTEGENDGICSVESAKWGDYKGIITGKKFGGMSHAGVIDFYRFNYSGTDIREKYIEIVEDLKNRGF